MTTLTVAFSLGLLAAAGGCNKKGDGSAAASRFEMIAKMTDLKDRMCACNDLTCARKVSDEVATYTRENAAATKKNNLDEAATKEAAAIDKELQQCMTSAMEKRRDRERDLDLVVASAAGSDSRTASGSDPLLEPLQKATQELLDAKTEDERIAAQTKINHLRAERLERGDYHRTLITELEKQLARTDDQIEDAKSMVEKATTAAERDHFQAKLKAYLSERDIIAKRLDETKAEQAALRAGRPDARM